MTEQLTDRFGRRIEYLRVSVTDRCNYRCFYCMPDEGAPCIDSEAVLSESELARVVRLFGELGVRRVRLTGGEPLVRRSLDAIVRRLRNETAVSDLSLTTNGHLLDRHAHDLRGAGLGRVNISLDTLNPKTFARITGRNALGRVIAGIDAALDAGLAPVRLNTVVMRGVNDGEIETLLDFAVDRGVQLRFIETMPVGAAGSASVRQHMPAEAVLRRLRAHCGEDLIPVTTDKGAGPARYYQLGPGPVRVGVISAVSQHFCDACNRVRLTASGDLVLCLGQEHAVPIGRLLRSGESDAGVKQATVTGIGRKPWSHQFGAASESVLRPMNVTGG